MSRKKQISRHYEPRLRAHRDSYRILDWASSASQEARFEVLAGNVDLTETTLLDVGCGLGDLYDFCRRRGIAVDYTGVDILETMVQAAHRRYPQGRFIWADIFADEAFKTGQFDVVFCSGTFNLNLGNNRQFLPKAMGRLLDLARHAIVVNLLDAKCSATDPRYFYFDPSKVREMLRPSGWDVRIVTDYLPNDFTVICTKGHSP